MSKYLTPVLVLVVALLAITIAWKGEPVVTGLMAQNVTTAPTTLVSNAAPTVGNINCYLNSVGGTNVTGGVANITLAANASQAVACQMDVNDANGGQDFNGTLAGAGNAASNGRFRLTSLTDTCTDDVKNCYVNGSATSANCGYNDIINSTAQHLVCTFFLKFNAANTSKSDGWTVFMNMSDTSGSIANATRVPHYVSDLLAIDVPTALNLGTISAGTNNTNAATTFSVSNFGNVRIDLLLNGSDLGPCSGTGTIPVGYMKYNCTASGVYATQSTSLTGTLSDSATPCSGFDLNKNSAAGASTTLPTANSSNTYWGIGAPTGTRGTCAGTIWITAMSG